MNPAWISRCGRCGEEIRFGQTAGVGAAGRPATAWHHQPGSPGQLDGHTALLGTPAVVSADTYRRKAEELEEEPDEPVIDTSIKVVMSREITGWDEIPPTARSPIALCKKLIANDMHPRVYIAEATRGPYRHLYTVGIAAEHPVTHGRIAAVWLYDTGVKDPAWKFESAIAWGPQRYTALVGATKIMEALAAIERT